MIENRDQLIGIRFTKKEKAVIKSLAENRNLTLTDFIREAVFSHINHLKKYVGDINVDFFMEKFNTMNDSITELKKCIKLMKKEFDIYDLVKIEHTLLKSDKELRNLENL